MVIEGVFVMVLVLLINVDGRIVVVVVVIFFDSIKLITCELFCSVGCATKTSLLPIVLIDSFRAIACIGFD